MSLPIPLGVELITSRATRRIEHEVHDLSFRSVIPGGFASARFTLSRKLATQPDEILYYARVRITCLQCATVVWEGRLEDPGRSVGSSGELWELAAIGPSGHAHDRTVPLIYVDRSLERWRRQGAASSPRSTSTIEELDDNDPALRHMFAIGASVSNQDAAIWIYRALWESGQSLGLVACTVDNGATTADWENRIATGVGAGTQTARDVNTWSTTPSGMYCALGSGIKPLTQGDNVVGLRIVRSGGSVTLGGAGDGWGLFSNVVVACMRYNADGTAITTGYGVSSDGARHYAYQIVNDLLGRLLNQYDGANAYVEQGTFLIDQCAYPDGVTPAKVLEDMMLIAPDHYWAAWEANSAGKYRFEWRAWPATVAYDTSVEDGYSSTGSAEGLVNAISVRYRDRWGFIRTARRTSTVPVLVDAGLTREAFQDLGDEIASAANAVQIGDQFLIEHATPPNQGRLTISRPIYDHSIGQYVDPWEIRPGKLIRVRGILASSDALNAIARDGVTVFRVVAVDFDAASASATLELDNPSVTLAHLLAIKSSASVDTRRRR